MREKLPEKEREKSEFSFDDFKCFDASTEFFTCFFVKMSSDLCQFFHEEIVLRKKKKKYSLKIRVTGLGILERSRGVQIIWLTTTKSITKPFHFVKSSPVYEKSNPNPFNIIMKNRFRTGLIWIAEIAYSITRT